MGNQDLKAKEKLLEILQQLFNHHSLSVVLGEETLHPSASDTSGPPFLITINSTHFFRDAGAFGEIELADAFIRGDITIPDDDLPRALAQIVPIIQKAPSAKERQALSSLSREYRHLVSPLRHLNPRQSLEFAFRDIRKLLIRGSVHAMQKLAQINLPVWATQIIEKTNIQSHYDLPDEVYHLFLSSGGDANEEIAYSCAYPANPQKIGVSKDIDPDMSLEQAQENKFEIIARKIGLHRVDKGAPIRLLDIGCGVGGFLLHCLTHYGDRIEMATGVTLSERQLDTARRRAKELGLSAKIDLRLQNYRDITGTFDRIASVGMAEHVGFENMDGFLRKINTLLASDGRALLHLIISQRQQLGGPDGWVSGGSQFIEERIFPGGQVPELSDMHPWINKSGMTIEHEHLFGYYYYWTLLKWYQNFCRNKKKIETVLSATGYELPKAQKVIQQYKLYLAGCAAVFQQGILGLAQFTLNKEGIIRNDDALERFMSEDDISIEGIEGAPENPR